MAARSTMASLILRIRDLINDPASTSQVWQDQQIQDVLDESRVDVINGVMTARATFSGSTIQYFDYFTSAGSWEDGMTLRQYLTVLVTPSAIEPIVGHFTFSASILPPVFITGKNYDRYRAAADMLERWAAKWVMSYNMTVDGQNLARSQVVPALLNLAKQYRMKQRPGTIKMVRDDFGVEKQAALTLGPHEIDYF